MAPYLSRNKPKRLKQKNQHEEDESVDWSKILFLARGCEGEYIQAGGMSIRIFEGAPAANVLRVAVDTDPIAAMQDGIPVLYYLKGVGFEQRVLKVDNRLSFCYVMSLNAKVDRGSNVLVIPLQQIRVCSNHEALELCKSSGVSDPNITFDTVVVVEVVPLESPGGPGSVKARGTIHVFIVPPNALLKERLQACSARKEASCKGSSDGLGQEVRSRLDGVRLKDPFSVYKEPRTFELEVQFLSVHGYSGGSHIVQRLHPPLDSEKLEAALRGIEERGYPLYPTDEARVSYVLREIAVTHSWAKRFKQLLQDDFHAFLNMPPVNLPHKDEAAESAPRERGPALISKCCEVRKPVYEDEYSKAHVRALVCALRQGLELDDAILRKQQEVEKTNAEWMVQTLEKVEAGEITTDTAAQNIAAAMMVGGEEIADELTPSPFGRRGSMGSQMSRRESTGSQTGRRGSVSRLSDRVDSMLPGAGRVIRERESRRDSLVLVSQLSEKFGCKPEASEAAAAEAAEAAEDGEASSPTASAPPSARQVDNIPTAVGKAREEPVGAAASGSANARTAPAPSLPVSKESGPGKGSGGQSPSTGGTPSTAGGQSPWGKWSWSSWK